MLSKKRIKKNTRCPKKSKKTKPTQMAMQSEVALIKLNMDTMQLVVNDIELGVISCSRLIDNLLEEREQLKARVCALENCMYAPRRYDDVLKSQTRN